MKKFLSFISTVAGVFALFAAAALVFDRLFYKNGPATEYISCDCTEDDE